jgi:hypothetical protein
MPLKMAKGKDEGLSKDVTSGKSPYYFNLF